MADGAGAGQSTSLQGLRKRMVAAAHAIAEERRNQSGVSSVVVKSSTVKTSFKPVLDGSVLKNDIKQKLAKERREEKKRLQDATKEMQLLEKERKSKIQYEKQLEEKQRKLREQKEKDEQRRASAEIKRKQKLEEEKEKFRAVLDRAWERRSRVDYRQKRWSWEGSIAVNLESKSANKRSVSAEKLEQENVGFNRCMFASYTGLQNPLTKKTDKKSSSVTTKDMRLRSCFELEQPPKEQKICVRRLYASNALVSRLLDPTQASLARSQSTASLSIPGKDGSGININLLQHLKEIWPLRNQSNNELKIPILAPQPIFDIPIQARSEISPKENVGTPPKISSSEAGVKESLVEAAPGANVEIAPKTIVAESPEAGVGASSNTSVEALPEATVVCVATPPEADIEASPKSKVGDLPQKFESETDKQASNLVTKKRPSSNIPCHRWPSSASGWRPPSPIKLAHKNRPPSPPIVTSKQSTTYSLSYKVMPIQPNTLITTTKKKKAVCKTINNKCEAPSHKNTTVEETSTKITPGILTVAAATRSFTGKQRIVREQQEQEGGEEPASTDKEEREEPVRTGDREEREKKEVEESVLQTVKVLAKQPIEGLGGDFLILEKDQKKEPRQKATETKKGCQDHQFQKGDAQIKAQEDADKKKKERERLMLQNLQERLERKKRIEEIMKRTRKSDLNLSKQASETSGHEIVEEEADDAEGTESDDKSSEEITSSASSIDISMPQKLKKKTKTVKKMPLKLTYLDASGGYTTIETTAKETKSFNGDVKISKKTAKDPSTETKRPATENMVEHSASTLKSHEMDHKVGTSNNKPQGWICDHTVGLVGRLEPPLLNADDRLFNRQQTMRDLMQFQQSVRASMEDRKAKSVSSNPES